MRVPTEVKSANTIRRIDGIDLVIIDNKIQEFDSHVNATKSGAHLIANITGLQGELDGKLDGNEVTGSITVVTSVNFTAETVTTKTISYTDGQITGVV